MKGYKVGSVINAESKMSDENMIGKSQIFQIIKERAKKLADSSGVVLITGETGTGKEMLARWMHGISQRCNEKLVKVTIPNVPPSLFESELLGSEKGAYTGAVADRKGYLQQVGDGFLLLDEIGDLPLDLQIKLLPVLEDNRFQKLGSHGGWYIANPKIIVATNRNLEEMMEEKKLRPDLYYRLKVHSIELPPLRERPEDIPLLAKHFLSKYFGEEHKFDQSALDLMSKYQWPGNVRQLANAVNSVGTEAESFVITSRDFVNISFGVQDKPTRIFTSNMTLENVTKFHIAAVLEQTHGNRSRAAKILGISRRALLRKIEKYT
jgi:transcriptional regulator with PAS, ATPase and Fis domain